MRTFWLSLSATAQDWIILMGLLLPVLVIAVALMRGFAPWILTRAILLRYRWVNLVFIALIAVSVGMSIGLIAQERGLRVGSAQAAEKFDIVVGAPGSDLTLMFASVFLQPTNMPLLDGAVFNALHENERVDFAAPLGFGDSFDGAPVIGTTADFALHLTDGQIEGRIFAHPFEAVVGPDIDLDLGDTFVPAHGIGDAALDDVHGDEITVVGRFAPTHSPWDNAILTPIEGVWLVHAMGNGREDLDDMSIGPPYEASVFPGTPAIIVRPSNIAAAYGLQAQFQQREDTMAIFPGTVLARLHSVMGDVRSAMSIMSTVTQMLVAASVLTGLFILSRLYQPQLNLLHTLGAPGRFVASVVWLQASVLLAAGTALGLAFGYAATLVLGRVVTARTGIHVAAQPGWAEVHIAAMFLTLSSLLALILALYTARNRFGGDGSGGGT